MKIPSIFYYILFLIVLQQIETYVHKHSDIFIHSGLK